MGMHVEPQKEHHWLQRLVGDWTSETEAPGENGGPPVKLRGSESVRPLGSLWILAEGRGDMPGGGTANMLLTLGYDEKKRAFVGTWIGSMMTYMWVYEGSLDAGGRKLVLRSEGPNCADEGKSMMKVREEIEFKSDDHRTFTSHWQDKDGNWTQMMEAHYYRKK